TITSTSTPSSSPAWATRATASSAAAADRAVGSAEQFGERRDERCRVLVDRLAVQLDLGFGAARADLHAHAAVELEPQQIGLRVLLGGDDGAPTDLGRRVGDHRPHLG